MYVVCVRQGEKYGPEYVTALRRQVKEHTGQELICLTDQEDTPGYKCWMRYGFEGWWSKIELFAPEWECIRPCFYLDLDTYVRDDVSDFLIEPEDLWLIRDLNVPTRGNSGLMILPERTHEIWNAALQWQGKRVDGNFLTTQKYKPMQDHFHGIHSYKNECRERPKGRIICFHGKPKPHETEGWAKEYWNHYA